MRDLTGMRFGRLQVLWPAGRAGTQHKVYWACQCDDGTVLAVSACSLNSGHTISCGCYCRERSKLIHTKHGHAPHGKRSAEYRSYMAAKERCSNPHNRAFAHYGGRGIKFLFESFREFIAELGLKPHKDLTVDRIDNDGHYQAGNVRWATRKVQVNNRRVKRVKAPSS